jgi:hypothetical protein
MSANARKTCFMILTFYDNKKWGRRRDRVMGSFIEHTEIKSLKNKKKFFPKEGISEIM